MDKRLNSALFELRLSGTLRLLGVEVAAGPLQIVSLSPFNGSPDVADTLTELVITFNQPVQKSAAPNAIVIRRNTISVDSLISSDARVVVSGNQVRITGVSLALLSQDPQVFDVYVGAGAFESVADPNQVSPQIEFSDWSFTVSASSPDSTAPTAPANLVASNIASTSFTLSWDAATDAVGVTGYRVYQVGNMTPILTLGNVLTTNISSLTEATTYGFYVTALDAAGNESSSSSPITVTTLDVTAPGAPQNLAISNLAEDSLTLSWEAASDNVAVTNYRVFQVGNANPLVTLAGNVLTYPVTGLSSDTSYSFVVVALDAAGNISPASNTATATTPAGGAAYNELTDFEADSVSEALKTEYFKARYAGGRLGGSAVVLPNVNFTNDELVTLAYNATTRNECGFKVTRLSRFDDTLPTSGDASSLRSEWLVSTAIDETGKFLFFEKHQSQNLVVYEVDTIARSAVYLRRHSIADLSSAEREYIHAHPTKKDTVIAQKGTTLVERNLRTDAETEVIDFGFTPALNWANGDGNGVYKSDILIAEAAAVNQVFPFDLVNAQAVHHVNGVRTLIPNIADRVITTLPAPGSSGLDYANTDGDGFVVALCKDTSGPDGGSGLYYYSNGAYTGGKAYGATGHYSRAPMEVGGELIPGYLVKVTPGQASDFGAAFNQGDLINIGVKMSWTGSAWTMTRTARRGLPWIYSNSVPSGGQHSGIHRIPNRQYISMKGAYSTTTENAANYISEAFFAKEEIFEFDLTQGDSFRRLGKNMTSRNSPVNYQTEINVIGIGADGTVYLVLYSRLGPADGDPNSSDELSGKDIWLFQLPPMASDSDIQFYLSQ